MHGHRYVVEAYFVADELDSLGRVVDFGVIKEKLSGWIDENWDHNVILWEKDKDLGNSISASTGQKVFYLQNNPTAENIAAYLFEEICPKIFKDTCVNCIKIRVYETPNCFVDIE
jgi:6-pyruvoyltetrahydropterin/6-carboxytetrahydropterin synthase